MTAEPDLSRADDLWFTVTEAAQILGVRPDTVSSWVHRGKLAAAGRTIINGRNVATYRYGDLVAAGYNYGRVRLVRAGQSAKP